MVFKEELLGILIPVAHQKARQRYPICNFKTCVDFRSQNLGQICNGQPPAYLKGQEPYEWKVYIVRRVKQTLKQHSSKETQKISRSQGKMEKEYLERREMKREIVSLRQGEFLKMRCFLTEFDLIRSNISLQIFVKWKICWWPHQESF